MDHQPENSVLTKEERLNLSLTGSYTIPKARDKEKNMRYYRWLAWAILVAAVCSAGCNTVRGVGQDLEEGGRAIQQVGR